jgi:predicted alpha/beta-hydrolase family hydrolase
MQKWRLRLSSFGRVVLFDYDYMREGRNRPDRPPQLVEAHRKALSENRTGEETVILIGKSMGGRIGCHVSLVDKVSGLICLGYPLCGGGDPNKLRDKVLRDLNTPILFVQGTRDPLCPLDLLDSVRAQMKASNTLHVVDEADHSLLLRKGDLKRLGKTQDDIEDEILKSIVSFTSSIRHSHEGV